MKNIKHPAIRFTQTAIFLLIICLLIPIAPLTAQKKKKKRKKKEKITIPANIVLTEEDGLTRYRIIIPSAPTSHEVKASEVLQDYLLQISGAALPVITADKSKSDYEIVLGQNERLDELRLGINLNAPGDRTSSDNILWLEYPNVGGTSPGIEITLDSVNYFEIRKDQISIQSEKTS